MLAVLTGRGYAQSSNQNANQLVSFLEGYWHNYSIVIADNSPVNKEDYKETMSIKNDSTLTITAHNYKEGKDLTKEMILIIRRNIIIMQQGNFTATGKREGNAYYLKESFEDKEYRFRIYTMGDKYIFHNELWAEEKIEMMNMSYLERE